MQDASDSYYARRPGSSSAVLERASCCKFHKYTSRQSDKSLWKSCRFETLSFTYPLFRPTM